MNRLTLALAAVVVAGLTGGALYVKSLAHTVDTLREQNVALTLALDAANVRVANITKDKKSDAEIDNIPDDGLRSVPDHWLLPRTLGDGGLY